MIFWYRRWIEHSRSKRCTTLPWVSPKICTSMCRGATRALDEHRAVAEGGRPPPAGPLRRLVEQLGRALDHPHPPAAAAKGRLDQQRATDRARPATDGVARRAGGDGRPRAGPARRPSAISSLAAILEPIDSMTSARGADEDQPGAAQAPGEARVLGEEAVAGVDGVGAGRAGRVDQWSMSR